MMNLSIVFLFIKVNIPCTFQFSSPWVHHKGGLESFYPAKQNASILVSRNATVHCIKGPNSN